MNHERGGEISLTEDFSRFRSDVEIRTDSEPDVQFWSYVLKTSPEELRQAVDLVGPEALAVVQYLWFSERAGLSTAAH